MVVVNYIRLQSCFPPEVLLEKDNESTEGGAETNGAETNGAETNGAETNGAETNGAETNGDAMDKTDDKTDEVEEEKTEKEKEKTEMVVDGGGDEGPFHGQADNVQKQCY
jgi:hypothetical protein